MTSVFATPKCRKRDADEILDLIQVERQSMYNQEVKERFIKEAIENKSRKTTARNLFMNAARYEKSMGKDICRFTTDELQPVVNDLFGMRTKSVGTNYSILKDYSKWCAEQGIEIEPNGIAELKFNDEYGLDKLRSQTVASPEHLQSYLDDLCDPVDKCTVDCVTRCYLWLAFSGVDEETVLSVTADNIDLVNMEIIIDDTRYPVYGEAVPAFENCVKSKVFMYKHPNYGAKVRHRADSAWLLRGFSEARSLATLRSDTSRKCKRQRESSISKCGPLNITYFRVQLSGIFYRAYENEQAGVLPDFMDVAAKFMEGKTYKLDKSRNLPGAVQRRLAKEYMEDYIRWKKAYSLCE